ncbi:outer membrane protein assembly factor BamE [Amylibacter marinus]|uniref:Outer membrane protein assembly factor BamE n=1 Tax=Amylibacter marinus TaxID=1475483 RepID=A0ABQ5VTN0_9RHOB|nr:outer membrane protein assembly factor BamE [Amylibacter marinus]GLQ34797.1 outer membrane protein assembly factor BamE [Amylibacter marinus]
MSKTACRVTMSLLLCASLAACSATFRDHGYLPDQDTLDQVVVGVDNRASIEDILGAPNSTGLLVDGDWYYIRSRVRSYAFFEPKVVEREMVAVSFDGEGIVENVERFGIEDGRVITLSRRVTEQPIKGPTFLRQVLSSLGNLDPGSLIDG